MPSVMITLSKYEKGKPCDAGDEVGKKDGLGLKQMAWKMTEDMSLTCNMFL